MAEEQHVYTFAARVFVLSELFCQHLRYSFVCCCRVPERFCILTDVYLYGVKLMIRMEVLISTG